jgi:hypothetical protein
MKQILNELKNYALIIIGSLILLLFILYLYIFIYGQTAPKIEKVKREVFVNTPSYILGKEQIINKYKLEYLKEKDSQNKEALRIAILDEASTVDITQLSPSTRSFLESLR